MQKSVDEADEEVVAVVFGADGLIMWPRNNFDRFMRFFAEISRFPFLPLWTTSVKSISHQSVSQLFEQKMRTGV